MTAFVLIIFMALSAGVAIVAAVLNSRTPMQLGPIPVLGGAAIFVVCVLALIARHVVWK